MEKKVEFNVNFFQKLRPRFSISNFKKLVPFSFSDNKGVIDGKYKKEILVILPEKK